jgi:hypothetical protein
LYGSHFGTTYFAHSLSHAMSATLSVRMREFDDNSDAASEVDVDVDFELQMSAQMLMLECQLTFARVVRDRWADVKIIMIETVHKVSVTGGGDFGTDVGTLTDTPAPTPGSTTAPVHWLALKLRLRYGAGLGCAHLTIAHGYAAVGADPPKPKQIKNLQDNFRRLDIKRTYTYAPNFALCEPSAIPVDNPHRVIVHVHRSSLLHDKLTSIYQQACVMYKITDARDGFHLSIDWVERCTTS